MTKPRATDLIIFDGSNAAHRISAATQPLTNSKGERVEVMFGLLRLLSSVIRANPAKECYVVWDGRGSRNIRQKLDPDYKANRGTNFTEEDKARIQGMHDQVQKFWELFGKNLPIKWLISERYEADDIISMLTHQADRDGRNAVVVSGDKDLLQLVTKHVTIFSPNSMKYCTLENFEEYTKGYPEPWAFLYGKCLQGDSSDNVVGIPGIGEKTALKILSQHRWALAEILSMPTDELKRSAVGQKLLNDSGKKRLGLNYSLMSLHAPLHDTMQLKRVTIERGNLNTLMLKTFFAKQQFVSLLASFSAFIAPFLNLEA